MLIASFASHIPEEKTDDYASSPDRSIGGVKANNNRLTTAPQQKYKTNLNQIGDTLGKTSHNPTAVLS